MRRIIVIDGSLDIDSPALKYAKKASKVSDTEIAWLFLAPTEEGTQSKKIEEHLNLVRQKLEHEGVGFSSYIVAPKPLEFMNKINSLTPANLVLIGDVTFSNEMKKGGVSIESLKEKISCPIANAGTIEAAHARKSSGKEINWGKFLLYFTGSAAIYGLFFPKIAMLNEKLFMSRSVAGALAIIGIIIVHAWVWGNTTHDLPKLFKLEK
ncbi:MAG: hypothetical protein HQK89_03875 [Nitrospirae bacterium]|nr:hypothetical protein [Nitrospirota bacterium]